MKNHEETKRKKKEKVELIDGLMERESGVVEKKKEREYVRKVEENKNKFKTDAKNLVELWGKNK